MTSLSFQPGWEKLPFADDILLIDVDDEYVYCHLVAVDDMRLYRTLREHSHRGGIDEIVNVPADRRELVA